MANVFACRSFSLGVGLLLGLGLANAASSSPVNSSSAEHSPASSEAPPSRPSTLPYCPSNYVECGTCRCVPESTCQWCPAAPNTSDPYQPPPNETHPIPSRPSTVPYCPGGYVDCGTCLCVPSSTCQWCSGGAEPYEPPPKENYPITPTWPSRVPYCPRTFVDCGSCPCVPASTCRWCTGGGRRLDEASSSPVNYSSTELAPASSEAPPSRPSTLPYCPSNYVECGTCRCVPQSTCQWCPAAPNTSVPYQPPPNETHPIPSRPSTVPYCPGGYVDCGTCLCVPSSTCQWCSGGAEPYEPPPKENYPITPTWPSWVPYCPRTFVDCGSCPCVPASTCRWCTGGGRRLDEEGSIETSLSNGHAAGEPGRPLLV
ncbi:unnamed protein product [Polarella glacialis]|uniref:Uncharacterized protein n=1 Tax=Polarella glacialis TaxID=89957 RepID=A0A813IU27_POLGL|nr:unnamed protein product [Polarella glacialis]